MATFVLAGIALLGIAFMVAVFVSMRSVRDEHECESVHVEPDPAWDIFIERPAPGVAHAVPRKGHAPAHWVQ